MTIKKQNYETIVKQLTELFNDSFEHSLDKTIKNNASINESKTLHGFINDWIDKTAYDPFYCCYSQLMREDESHELYCIFHEEPNNRNVVDQELLIRMKKHNGSIKEALLAIVKPLLVEKFVTAVINSPETAIELLSVVNHYNDYDYQLKRFISVFEENLLQRDEYKNPLDLLGVWWLDKTFLKKTIIPELKKRTLTDEQKQKAAIHKSCMDLVHNYYDYCLYYAFSGDDGSKREELYDTTFFYDKKDFDQTIIIIKNALLAYEKVCEEELDEWVYEDLLEQTLKTKPEWVDDSLRELLKSS